MPTISIVTPCYNSSKHILETVQSVLSQSFQDWEYIIVDDGSTDNTLAIIASAAASEPRIRIVKQLNQGVASARNTGYQESHPSSEFLIFLDHDDIWEPNALELLLGSLEKHPECVAAHGLPTYQGQSPTLFQPNDIESYCRDRKKITGSRLVNVDISEPTTFASLAYRCYIPTPGILLIKKYVLTRSGLFDPKAVPSDDWDLWLRVSALGNIAFLNNPILYWRIHEGNVSHDVAKMAHAEQYVRNKILSTNFSLPQQTVAQHAHQHRLKEMYQGKLQFSTQALTKYDLHIALKQFRYSIKPLIFYGYYSMYYACYRLFRRF